VQLVKIGASFLATKARTRKNPRQDLPFGESSAWTPGVSTPYQARADFSPLCGIEEFVLVFSIFILRLGFTSHTICLFLQRTTPIISIADVSRTNPNRPILFTVFMKFVRPNLLNFTFSPSVSDTLRTNSRVVLCHPYRHPLWYPEASRFL